VLELWPGIKIRRLIGATRNEFGSAMNPMSQVDGSKGRTYMKHGIPMGYVSFEVQ
jgi:hypothetical protein